MKSPQETPSTQQSEASIRFSGGYTSLANHTKVTLESSGAMLEYLRELSQLVSVLPLAIPEEIPVHVTRLQSNKFLIDFMGNEVKFQVLPTDESKILEVDYKSDGVTLRVVAASNEYIIELKHNAIKEAANQDRSNQLWDRTTYPFRESEVSPDRNSESRGGCGGGER